ncbi:MAG: PhzF family phenazine biosynthesis protein [Planctomycetota bacterium]
MSIALDIVDAFTDRAFAGNPAAVCRLPVDQVAQAAWMQQVAAEMNLSETAFVSPPDEQGVRPVRYFTPKIEVELCGHATLAAAHTLWHHGEVPATQPVRFRTVAHEILTCTLGPQGEVRMDLPASPPKPAAAPAGLDQALGMPATDTHRAGFQWLGVWPEAQAVRDWTPNHAALAALDWGDRHGLVLTAPGGTLPDGRPADFTSRFFAPGAGIAEDPVTGSAHAMLGPYWAQRLGKTKLLAHQASPRGGTLEIEVRGARVVVAGHAVTNVAGQWVGPLV